MCTYNRGDLLGDAITSVLAQDPARTPAFELLVVDNNSTDGTRAIVERLAADDRRLRYVHESRQGLSIARNTGVRETTAPYIAFTDDDIRAEPDWIAALVRTFEENPGADVGGGRVLPIWPVPPPAWLTRDHWAPLALLDHGDAPFAITRDRPICLVGANLAFRRRVFETCGGFAAEFQRVKDGIGSLEDHEFLLRLLRTGARGVYDPRIVVHAEVQASRMHRAYHRRWHTGHGHFHALLRSEHLEASRRGTFLGVPAHFYRQAAADVVGWVRAAAAGRQSAAFESELRLWFFSGFFRTRCRQFMTGRAAGRTRTGQGVGHAGGTLAQPATSSPARLK